MSALRQAFRALVAVALLSALAWSRAQDAIGKPVAPHRAGAVLVGFKPGLSARRHRAVESRIRGARRSHTLLSNARLAHAGPRVRRIGAVVRLRVRRGTEVRAARRLRGMRGVRFAE